MQSSRYTAMLKRCGHEQLGLDFARIARAIEMEFPDGEPKGLALYHIENAALWTAQTAVCCDCEDVHHASRMG